MRILAIPNWSFGRDRRLLADCHDALSSLGLTIHYCESDIDHNRTVIAFSGELEPVEKGLFALSEMILPGIDLNRHVGVHPRIGGLDVCPFIALDIPKTKLRAQKLRDWVESVASHFAEKFEVPVFLYEKSEKGRHESDLPALRKGGFGGLLERTIEPDFGPKKAHPQLGATIMGWRDFLVAVNVNLNTVDSDAAARIAVKIRELRADGDERMLGVRALGFALASRDMSQVSLNLTLPDLTPLDPVLEFVSSTAAGLGVEVAFCELVGVIRDTDLPNATRINPRDEQIVHIGVRV